MNAVITVNDDTKVGLMLEVGGVDVNGQSGTGNTPLMAASRCSSNKIVQMLLEKGANVNVKDNSGATAFMKCKTTTVADLLIAAGAEVGARNNDEQTAFDIFRLRKDNSKGINLVKNLKEAYPKKNFEGDGEGEIVDLLDMMNALLLYICIESFILYNSSLKHSVFVFI